MTLRTLLLFPIQFGALALFFYTIGGGFGLLPPSYMGF